MAPKDDEILSTLVRMREEQLESRAEMAENFSKLDKKVDLHIQKTEYELEGIHKQDGIQNKLLDEHIAGVKTLTAIHDLHVKENEERFSKLEEPRKFLKTLGKILVAFGAAGGALAGVTEMIARLKGH